MNQALPRLQGDQVMLGFSPAEAARLVREAARAVGLRVELLRVHLFASACQRAAQLALAQRVAG